MDKKLKVALKQNFTPPELSQNRDKFVNSSLYPKAKFSEVFLSQIVFIRKRVWMMFAIFVCFAFFYVNIAEIRGSIIANVSAILPLFVLCVTSEIYKSVSYHMDEMEIACKYNLSKITLMRLGILSTISFVMLLLFIVFFRNSDYGMLRCLIYLAIPFLLSSYLSLLVVIKFRIREPIYICASICGSISTFMLLIGSNYYFIYNVEFTYLWVIIFFILSLLLLYCFIKFIKFQEDLQWNLV